MIMLTYILSPFPSHSFLQGNFLWKTQLSEVSSLSYLLASATHTCLCLVTSGFYCHQIKPQFLHCDLLNRHHAFHPSCA